MWVAPKAPAGMAEGNRESFGPRVGLSSHGSPAKGGPKSKCLVRVKIARTSAGPPSLTISDPSRFPASDPSRFPASDPSRFPASDPSRFPASDPSRFPASDPSRFPASDPSRFPASDPSRFPASDPSRFPASDPSRFPASDPSRFPASDPSRFPASNICGPGRPGWSPTQAPHRSGLAHHAHPVPHLMNSRPARSVVVTWTRFRSQCTWHVSLQRLMRRHLLPSTGSLGLVPPLQRYYEVLRLPAAHFAALRFLRLAIPSLRPLFVPPAPDAEPWINLELVGGISSRLARWKRQGLPSSRRNPCDHSPYSSDPGVTRQAEWTMG